MIDRFEKRQNAKAIDRSEMQDVRRAIAKGWNVPAEKLRDVADRCRALLADPEAYPRDRDAAEKTLAAIQGVMPE